MEAIVVTFKESWNQIVATDLEANPEETTVTTEQQEVHNEEMNVDINRLLEDISSDMRLQLQKSSRVKCTASQKLL
jgi:hypothetical protein